MNMIVQKSYTCRCGKKRQYPAYSQMLVCGCGRTITFNKDGKVKIEDKK